MRAPSLKALLASESGETLVETLVSMAVIALVFAFLVNAVVIAARINAAAQGDDSSLDFSQAKSASSVAVKVGSKEIEGTLYEVSAGGAEEDDARYYYYE